jgi:hypothetical protein
METTNKTPNPAKQKRITVINVPDFIKTFNCDSDLIDGDDKGFARSGHLVTIHSLKRELWSLQSSTGFIIGVGNPLHSNKEYAEYLNNIPCDIASMLEDMFKHFGFSDSKPLLFNLKNTIRLIPFKKDQDLFYLYFPDDSVEIISSNPVPEDRAPYKYDIEPGKRINAWLHNQFSFTEGEKKRVENSKDK